MGPPVDWQDAALYVGRIAPGLPVRIETVIPDEAIMACFLAGATCEGTLRFLIEGVAWKAVPMGDARQMVATRYTGPLTLVLEVESPGFVSCHGSVARMQEPSAEA